MEEDYYFEGPEKNLEVWFEAPTVLPLVIEGGVKHPRAKLGLRSIPREQWEDLLSAVRCTILSSTHTEYMDSYVLSESSMFVTPYRFILKTCGQTTLLYALDKLIELAKGIGLTHIQELFFSRHNLLRPDMQHGPHKSFQEEVKYLDTFFAPHPYDGCAFTLGRINDKDTCYLYTLDSERSVPVADHNLEIQMFELDPEAMMHFYKSDTIRTCQDASDASGISSLFPEAILDGFLFEPCGYSVNGMMGEHYFTIHITPQQGFSFVSFETDVPMTDYTDLISRVLDIFRPNRATVTVMANRLAAVNVATPRVPGFQTKDIQRLEFSDYHLLYARLRPGKCSLPSSPTAPMSPVSLPSDGDRASSPSDRAASPADRSGSPALSDNSVDPLPKRIAIARDLSCPM
eukprot:m.222555 g.222555  ORF g.222555 m.222555 type:complete len:402 (+) comp10785_c0_seq1:184-1389(+)